MTEQTKGNVVLGVLAAAVVGVLLLWGVLDNTPENTGRSFPEDCVEVYGPNGMECG
jgi:hypothetical protein